MQSYDGIKYNNLFFYLTCEHVLTWPYRPYTNATQTHPPVKTHSMALYNALHKQGHL